MVIVMAPDATQADIQRVLERLAEQNCRGELTIGVERTIITVVGPSSPALEDDVRILDQVDSVVRLEKSYKLAGLDSNPGGTRVQVGDVEVGGPDLLIIAGPGSVESAQQVQELAPQLAQAGAGAITGATMRPDQSPYAFQGLGEDAAFTHIHRQTPGHGNRCRKLTFGQQFDATGQFKGMTLLRQRWHVLLASQGNCDLVADPGRFHGGDGIRVVDAKNGYIFETRIENRGEHLCGIHRAAGGSIVVVVKQDHRAIA